MINKPAFLIGLVFVIWLVFFAISTNGNLEISNEVGDSFNILNTLFAGLAFAVIYLSLSLQRQEFKKQIEEFEKTVEAQTDQAEYMKNQLVTNNYFTILDYFLKSFKSQKYRNNYSSDFEKLATHINEEQRKGLMKDPMPFLKQYFIDNHLDNAMIINSLVEMTQSINESKHLLSVFHSQLSNSERGVIYLMGQLEFIKASTNAILSHHGFYYRLTFDRDFSIILQYLGFDFSSNQSKGPFL